MRKEMFIFIDLRNKKQVKWFNTVGSRLAKCRYVDSIYETATGKEIGVILQPCGLFAKKVVKGNLKFIKDPINVPVDGIQ